ncbi:MAG TPA: acyl-CoA dehydratase activase [Polyangiaceae bacterium]|jgi:predicted CoA-substrate-specific enzyme activase|nr:MAG: R-phenyllactate dehydratase activator [Deltaproteobacteria bacterium ADurb.Bin207]HNS95974.1 acyl-CoA dehydratase activase [Polyangiaceae bacterium]HNZ22653.1 acyl-CoA dehydratase activase [Polyangiaceae bacterium]HOD21547.1 acyl-CoA dehydratase activase [Polyangiaceae bacterium]HOE48348.1 acyl-CoA dehydratase activase [Polyangiaceae bacterium]
MTIRIGIDVGSTTTKAVAVDDSGRVLARSIEPGDPRIAQQAQRMLEALLERVGGGGEASIVATGYGRKLVAMAGKKRTEISCHALGAFHVMNRPGVLIDVGGQDTKVIRLNSDGSVADFVMNDKCAAGTGRFLEVILARLGVSWDELADRYASADPPVQISSTCTVFAESEVISMLANGQPVDSVVKGLHIALSDRIVSMAGRLLMGVETVLLSGGVASNSAMVAALSSKVGKPVAVVPEPQFVGALGAALLG